MAKIDDYKAKARAALASARRGIASGARSASLGAKRLGRRASAMSSRERRAFCARTAAAETGPEILKVVNRALRMAFEAQGRPVRQIDVAEDAIRIGTPLRMMLGKDDKAKLARLAGEAAVHAGFAMQTGSEKEWNEAAEYADDAIDLGGSL